METEKKTSFGFAIHPGKILARELTARGMSHTELAVRAGTTEKTISQIIHGNSPISMDMAIKLEYALGISAKVWNNLQMNYQEALLRATASEMQEKEEEYAQALDYNELRKIYTALPATRKIGEKIEALRRMFGVSSLASIFETDIGKYLACARRSSAETSGKEPDRYALVSWLRVGEIKAQSIQCGMFDLKKLRNAIADIKKTINESSISDAWIRIKRVLLDCGVKLVAVPYLKNTYVNGAVRWIGENPVIIMSNRNAYADIFWFSLIHEICHILKHGKKYACVSFEQSIKCYTVSQEEAEADQFAADFFIPEESFTLFTEKYQCPSETAIIDFSKKMGIPAYMVIGRLARVGVYNWSDPIVSHRPKVVIPAV